MDTSTLSTRSLSVVGLGLAVGSLAVYYTWRKRNQPLQWEEVGHVTDLILYPVKSAGGLKVKKATATSHGLQTDNVVDRSFVVVMPSGGKNVNVTGAMAPALSTVQANVDGDRVHLSSFKADRSVTVDLKDALKSKTVKLILKSAAEVSGFDCGAEVATWLQELLYADTELSKRPAVQLVFIGTPENYKTIAAKPDIFPFPQFQDTDLRVYHDTCAFHLASSSSLEDLNSRLETPVTMCQLRGNIVVTGQAAFDEDHWAYVKIGETVVMRTLKPRETCVRININPEKGARQNEVLDTMRKYRVPAMPPQLAKHWSHKPFFGLHMGLGAAGEIAVGDKVYAVRKKPHWLL
ncbi:MOSC N-terminal beta barrel [Trinorchestia longiramus]|nr:MOSC N-terminal beta barrel [Trinorchestia longiramus]